METEETSYTVTRRFFSGESEELETGLTLAEAKELCSDAEGSSRTATSEEAMKLTRERGPWFLSFSAE